MAWEDWDDVDVVRTPEEELEMRLTATPVLCMVVAIRNMSNDLVDVMSLRGERFPIMYAIDQRLRELSLNIESPEEFLSYRVDYIKSLGRKPREEGRLWVGEV